MRTTQRRDKYDAFVEHPRYGNRPRITGLKPKPECERVFIHWHSPESCRIDGTAIKADLTRQTPSTVSVTHYFDVERICRQCNKPFIFFAEEQKHWYEELGFGLDSNCVRCPPCRKRVQGIARKRERYEELFHVPKRSMEQNLEMAECCLALIEKGIFQPRQTERVRMLLKRIPEDRQSNPNFISLHSRLLEVEKKMVGVRRT